MELADRKNEGKPKFGILPTWLLSGTTMRFELGAKKYALWNWMKGFPITELLSSTERHLVAFKSGETQDPEKGWEKTDHIDAIIANCLFIKHTMQNYPELDDRPKSKDVEDLTIDDLLDNVVYQIPNGLRDFLIEKKVCSAFVRYYKANKDPNKKLTSIHSFPWTTTQEGFEFWDKLSDEWKARQASR